MARRVKPKLVSRPHPGPVTRDRPQGAPWINSGRGRLLLLLASLALVASPARAQTVPLQLRLADVGRFATFVDLGSVEWTGRVAKLRVLQVTEGGFKAGTEEFWGGWRYEVIDCDARAIAHAGFSSIRAGGREGPITGDQRPAGSIAPGGADAATAKVVCDGWKPYATIPSPTSVAQAVAIGRPLIETGAEP